MVHYTYEIILHVFWVCGKLVTVFFVHFGHIAARFEHLSGDCQRRCYFR